MKYEAMNILTGEVVELEGMVPVFTQHLVPVPDLAETSSAEDTKTEQGYVPPEQQIRDMERAGLAHKIAQRARFDSDLYPDGVLDEEIALDPYRELGADIVDLARQAITTGARLRQQDAAAKKARLEAEKAAQERDADALASELEGKSAQEISALLKTARARAE